MHGVTGLNIYSLIVAVVGAVFLLIYHAIRLSRARDPAPGTSHGSVLFHG